VAVCHSFILFLQNRKYLHFYFIVIYCYATVSRPPVSLSVALSDQRSGTFLQIGWNILKIISPLTSLRFVLALTPTSAIWFDGNAQKNSKHKEKSMLNLKTLSTEVTISLADALHSTNKEIEFKILALSTTHTIKCNWSPNLLPHCTQCIYTFTLN